MSGKVVSVNNEGLNLHIPDHPQNWETLKHAFEPQTTLSRLLLIQKHPLNHSFVVTRKPLIKAAENGDIPSSFYQIQPGVLLISLLLNLIFLMKHF